MAERLISGTRVFGNFEPENFDTHIKPFVENARVFGPALIVSQEAYEYLRDLREYLGSHTDIVLSRTEGAQSPADMCNKIMEECQRRNLEYFGIVSSDLSGYIPYVFPELLKRLDSNPKITSAGVAVQGVHNLPLLESIKNYGVNQVTLKNYATIFHNNAFAIHRLIPNAGETTISLEDRLFPRITDQGKLGNIEIENQTIPVGGNEEIALALQLLQKGVKIDTLLLAGKNTIIRDPNQEISSIDAKILRRPSVALEYQKYYGITDATLSEYLQNHFHIDFS